MSDKDELMAHANRTVLIFCGSLIAVSIAFRIIGADLAPLIDAYSEVLQQRIKDDCGAPTDFENRIAALELISHPSKDSGNE